MVQLHKLRNVVRFQKNNNNERSYCKSVQVSEAYSKFSQTSRMKLLQKLLTAKTVSYFCKKLHLRYLTGFYMRLWVSKIRDDHSLLKVNSRNTRPRSEVCSKLTKKTLERCQRSMLTFNMQLSIWLLQWSNPEFVFHLWTLLELVKCKQQMLNILSIAVRLIHMFEFAF